MFSNRDCVTCTETNKRQWGCEGNAEMPIRIDDEEIWTCPRRPILDHPEFFAEVLGAYRDYQKGFLPEPGGTMSQPKRLMQCFKVIEHTVNECSAENKNKPPKGNPFKDIR